MPETELLPRGVLSPKPSSHLESCWVPRVLRQPPDQDPALTENPTCWMSHTMLHHQIPPETHPLCPVTWWPFQHTLRWSYSAIHQGHEQGAPSTATSLGSDPRLPGTPKAGCNFCPAGKRGSRSAPVWICFLPPSHVYRCDLE